MNPWKTLVEAIEEPVSLDDAKKHCRVDTDADDELLYDYIQSAREYLEDFTRRTFLTSTLTMTLDVFPCGRVISLPAPPLQGVESIVYLDSYGNSQTMGSTLYAVETLREPGRIVLLPHVAWPGTYDMPGCITIMYIAGWDDISRIPRALRQSVLLLTGHLYENREATIEKALMKIPFGICSLVTMHRIMEVY